MKKETFADEQLAILHSCHFVVLRLVCDEQLGIGGEQAIAAGLAVFLSPFEGSFIAGLRLPNDNLSYKSTLD